jgi:hypothetical protein
LVLFLGTGSLQLGCEWLYDTWSDTVDTLVAFKLEVCCTRGTVAFRASAGSARSFTGLEGVRTEISPSTCLDGSGTGGTVEEVALVTCVTRVD